MSEGSDGRPADRVATLLRSAVLIACLGAILVGAYGLVLPTGWSVWRLSILIASAGGLALMLSWPSRRAATRVRSADDVALMFGVASMILGIGAALLIAYGLALRISEARTSPQRLIYQLTHPSVLAGLLTFAVPAALLGGFGLWIAWRRDRTTGRVSIAGAAGRFSTVGLGIAGLIAAVVATMAIYRWLMWG
jgi:hypothetical protein